MIPEPAQAALMLAIIALVAMAVLIPKGIRGYRLDDLPRCRRCKYELTGILGTSDQCPECGSSLRETKDILRTEKHIHVAHLTAGIMLLLISGGALFEIGWTSLKDISLIGLETDRLLFYQLRHSGPSMAAQAEGELLSRYKRGTLGTSLLKANLPYLPVTRSAAALVYFDGGCELTEAAGAKGDVPPATWDAYSRSLCTYVINTRSKVRRGDPIPVSVHASIRAATMNSCYSVDAVATALDIDGIPCDCVNINNSERNMPYWAVRGGGTGQKKIRLTAAQLSFFKDGSHTLHVRGTLTVGISRPSFIAGSTFAFDATTTFTLLPADAQSVTLKVDPAIRPAIAAAVHRPKVLVDWLGHVSVRFHESEAPAMLVYDIVLKSRGKEWIIKYNPDDFFSNPGTAADHYFNAELPNFNASVVDVILRPNPTAAATFMGIDEIWGEDIVFPNVPVERERSDELTLPVKGDPPHPTAT